MKGLITADPFLLRLTARQRPLVFAYEARMNFRKLSLSAKGEKFQAAFMSFIAFHIVCGVAGIVKFLTPTGFNAS